jgi:para-nitrobenzyl esterase
MDKAGLKPGEVAKIQRILWRNYIDIANRAVEKKADKSRKALA